MRADFLIIGSGIAALRAAAALDGAGDVLVLTKAGPRAGNTGIRAGRASRPRSGRDDSPAKHHADTIAAGDGLCDEQRRRRSRRRRPALRPRADGVGRAIRSRRRRRAGARRSRRRTASAASCTRMTRPAARSAARSGSGCRGIGERADPRARARRLADRRGRPLRRRGVRAATAEHARSARARVHAARDRRRRPGVQRDHESAGRDRRRDRDGVSRRRGGRRSGVRAVPSDRAEDAGAAAVPAVGGAARRRGAPRERRRRAVHGRATIRPAIWRRATGSRAAIVREAQRTGGDDVS